MTIDAQEALVQVREALTAGPTPGPWSVASQGNPADDELEANAALIAACSPANIAAILAHVEAQEAEIERLRAVVSALAFQANRDPFTTIGHWCEHGPCAAIIRDVSNPYADHHGPDWTQRDSEYLK